VRSGGVWLASGRRGGWAGQPSGLRAGRLVKDTILPPDSIWFSRDRTGAPVYLSTGQVEIGSTARLCLAGWSNALR
jgi:hypothetical protein